MQDVKAFKTTNILLLTGICVSLFLLIPVQIKQSISNKNIGKTQYLDCVISEANHTITNDEVRDWLTEIRKLRASDRVTFLQIQLEEGQCVVPDELFDSGDDKFSYSLLDAVTNYLQETELYITLEGNAALSGEYKQLEALCNKFGMSIQTAEHDETRQDKTKTVKGQLYQFLGAISAGCSFSILFALELFFFQKRKKAWKLRRIFGVSVRFLLKETVLTQSVLFFFSTAITLLVLKGWYHFETPAMLSGVLIILTEYITINVFWISVLWYQTSPSSHHFFNAGIN